MEFDHDRMLDTVVARQRWAKVRVRATGLIILLALVAFPARWFFQEWTRVNVPTLEVRVPPMPPLIVPDAIVVSQKDDQRTLNHALKLDRTQFLDAFPALFPDDAPAHRVPLSDAFILEVSTHQNFDQAIEQVAVLRDRGYRAFVSLADPFKPSESAEFHVMVGPDLRKVVVEQWREELVDLGVNARLKLWSAGMTNRVEHLLSNKESG